MNEYIVVLAVVTMMDDEKEVAQLIEKALRKIFEGASVTSVVAEE